MKPLLPFLLSYVMVTPSRQAQQLKGIIVNEKGAPIPNSTVYIYEIAKRIAADNLGEFQTTLMPGDYTFEVRPLGYESATKNMVMAVKTRQSTWN